MRINHTIQIAAALLLAALNSPLSTALAQGSLTPPGPPAPTMKSLSDLDAKLEKRTPISSLPYTVSQPGSYYLTTNLTGVSGNNGINISSGNVTLDLCGFTMQGVGGSLSGIYFTATFTNITVRNGIITGWGNYGLDSHSGGSPRNIVFEKLTFSSNGASGLQTEAGSIVRDCMSMGNGANGLASYGGEISHCFARANGSQGIWATNATVRDSMAEYNGQYGFYLGQSSATGCRSQFNSSGGYYLIPGKLVDCQIESNSFQGVYAPAGPSEVRGCRIVGNSMDGIDTIGAAVVSDNYIANNGGNGIHVAGNAGSQVINNNMSINAFSAILIGSSSNRIDNNNIVTTSGNAGVFVNGTTNNVVTRNSVWGNGGNGFSYPAGNDVGPVGTAASSTSPWANFSH